MDGDLRHREPATTCLTVKYEGVEALIMLIPSRSVHDVRAPEPRVKHGPRKMQFRPPWFRVRSSFGNSAPFANSAPTGGSLTQSGGNVHGYNSIVRGEP